MVCRNGSVKDCGRQTSFKPPRGEPEWKKETAVLLYTLGLSMNAIAKQLGVSTPSILNWIRAHAATHAPRPQPEPGESVVVMELDELWHFLQKNPRRPAARLWPEKRSRGRI
jgi:transposase-like protein